MLVEQQTEYACPPPLSRCRPPTRLPRRDRCLMMTSCHRMVVHRMQGTALEVFEALRTPMLDHLEHGGSAKVALWWKMMRLYEWQPQ